ncbi:metal ABC transporter permease [Lacipirellula sp.]|uniref:metal ABC transporter permease n=1 Tax=Lacipirellula sp. TaxID=2691419 RepID=UPI003D0D78FC
MTHALIIATTFSDLWNTNGLWIVATAAATNCACALVGCYLVLRRMSLMGDALSHAVLPGLAVAFILSGAYDIGPLMIGAVAAGLLSTFLIQTLHQYARVPSDASMGVVFTGLFALGVVLIKKGIPPGVHFDIACVYQGTLELTPFDTVNMFGREVPRAFAVTAGVFLLNAAIIAALWKELKLSAFDPALATTMGFSASLLHYLLMALVAVTAVASFEAVGSILVVAMLIIPPATAHLLSDRLAPMVLISLVVAIAAAILGYILGTLLNTNLAGMITVAAAGLFGLAVLFAPQHGVVSALARNLSVSLRVVREDLLAMLYRIEELGSPRRLAAAEASAAVGGGWLARLGLDGLVREGSVTRTGNRLDLTPAGREAARQLVRSHRLWETYLVKHLGLPLDHVHEPAHRVEHFIGDQMREQLQQELDAASKDPHGREIPE